MSVLDVKGGIRYTLVVCSIKSGCESHSWFGNLGGLICGLLVTASVKMSMRTVIVIPGMRASLSTCAPQMVHLQTAKAIFFFTKRQTYRLLHTLVVSRL